VGGRLDERVTETRIKYAVTARDQSAHEPLFSLDPTEGLSPSSPPPVLPPRFPAQRGRAGCFIYIATPRTWQLNFRIRRFVMLRLSRVSALRSTGSGVAACE
jgi:hypothetical protein